MHSFVDQIVVLNRFVLAQATFYLLDGTGSSHEGGWHQSPATCVTIEAVGGLCITASKDQIIRIWSPSLNLLKSIHINDSGRIQGQVDSRVWAAAAAGNSWFRVLSQIAKKYPFTILSRSGLAPKTLGILQRTLLSITSAWCPGRRRAITIWDPPLLFPSTTNLIQFSSEQYRTNPACSPANSHHSSRPKVNKAGNHLRTPCFWS